MTLSSLIPRSLRFHARTHLGVVLGVAVAAAVLIGALTVGDSVRHSVRRQALARLGRTVAAYDGHDRFFRHDPGGPAAGDESTTGAPPAPDPASPAAAVRWGSALRLPALATRQDGTARANRLQVLGVDADFWNLAGVPAPALPAGGVLLSQALARQLRVQPGDEVILRIHKPSALSLDAVITPRDQTSVALRRQVTAILTPEQLGGFSLTADPGPALNAFVPLDELATAAGLAGRANLVAAALPDNSPPAALAALTGWADRQVSLHATLEDLELDLRLPDTAGVSTARPGDAIPRYVELATRRIFLEPPVTRRALEPAPGPGPMPVPILTYLVNGLAAHGTLTPYSMVTAAGPPYTPADLQDDEIVVNEWLAEDLGVKPGDPVELTYYRVDSGARLVELTNTFRVRSVVPLRGLAADRTLMPEFPGLAKAESTQQWDAGFDLVHAIREKDEAYWKNHRGTPKAFLSLKAGQTLWANRFGDLTAVRWFVPPGIDPAGLRDQLRRRIRSGLDPAELGLRFTPVREQALQAAASGTASQFGGLFIGFSFFLIVSALLLTAMLFRFGLEQRGQELGTLLALGWPEKQVRRLFIGESLALAGVGAVLGVVGGLAYGRSVLWGLTSLWRDAVAGAGLEFHAEPASVAIGALAAVAIARVTLSLTLRRALRRPARELLNEGLVERPATSARQGRRTGLVLAAGWLVAGLGLAAASARLSDSAKPGAFFGAGACLLLGGLSALSTAWRRPGHRLATDLASLAWRAPARQPRRSLATVALLASAVFLIVAVAANRLDATRNARARSAGTGGFALWAESALPVLPDLNTPAGREEAGLNARATEGLGVVPLRVRDGDDASCLNLNRAQRPRLLGVNPEDLARRGAFTFAALAQDLNVTNGWLALAAGTRPGADGVPEVPAIGDSASIQWGLGRKVGDTLDYQDERGRPFRVRLVGAVAPSILQGSLLVAETEFTRLYPSEAGHRAFLIDTPAGTETQVAAELTRALQDQGFETTDTRDRLARFNAVQNTYLNTFQTLGGLGLLLGSVGLGVVVLRNVFERRPEMAVLQAVGFPVARLRSLVLLEHGLLLVAGLVLGVIAALPPLIPVLGAPGAGFPAGSLALTLVLVLLNGLAWTWWATRRACSGSLLAALRGE